MNEKKGKIWDGRKREDLVKITYTFADGSEWSIEGDALGCYLTNEELDAFMMNMQHKAATKRYRHVEWKKKK